MSTLSNLIELGWTAREGAFSTYPCDVCGSPATFVRMDAPDCATHALAGVGGAHSDAYGIYCGPRCTHIEYVREVEFARAGV
jgi:hypothetical protein